ncbi:MAG: hypothetical protein RMM31_05990 [Anaerolineae bacterium]|nr:hypothetical protein [Anaerolineae bacterium]
MIPSRWRLLVAASFALAAFIHAALWGGVVPLWQINDESAHFEYVHMLVRLRRVPTPADADPEVQARILRSMWENRYWEYMGMPRPEQPPRRFVPGGWMSGGMIPPSRVVGDAYVGSFSQLSRSTPIYYALLAPLQAVVIHQPIDHQLHILRWGARVIFAVGVLFIVLAAGELFAWHTWSVLTTGVSVALHPMLAFIGSGLNNDNGVMLFASAALWQLAQGWRRGYSVWRLALIVGLVALALFTKRTAVFLVAWVPLVLGIWWLRRQPHARKRRFALGLGVGVLLLALLAATFYLIPGPAPAGWHIATPFGRAWQAIEDAPSGGRVFKVQNQLGGVPWIYARFRKPIGWGDDQPIAITVHVRGGAGAITLSDDVDNAERFYIPATSAWRLAVFTTTLDARASVLTLRLESLGAEPVFFDDVRVAVLTNTAQTLPVPNPSGESASPLLSEVVLAVARPLGVYPQAFRFLQDYRANLAAMGERLPVAILFTQQSFWGWIGEIGFAGNPTVHAGWITLLALGVGIALAHTLSAIASRKFDQEASPLLALCLVGVALLLIQTFAPLLSFAADGNWLPQGRYLLAGSALIASLLGANTHGRSALARLCVQGAALLLLGADLYTRSAQFFN